jgi:tetratricopeptide (TPR) repeat protein
MRRWHRRLMARALRKSVRFAQKGEPHKAFALLKRLAGAAPSVPRIHLLLAAACDRTAGDPKLAERAICAAECGGRATAGVLSRAAMFELASGDLTRAYEILNLALQRYPSSWLVWQGLGQLHLERGDCEQAIHCFHQQVQFAHSPKVWLQAMTDVARCYKQCGKKEEAVSAYRRIIDAVPGAAHAYWALVEAGESLGNGCELANTIRDLLGMADVAEDAQQFLHYALGVACDREGRPAEAFAHFHLANEIRAKKVVPINVGRLHQEVELRIKLFDRERIANLAQHGCRDHRPICIVGMPRSGTTLVEQIVSSHSAVHSLGERPDICRLTQTMRWRISSTKHYPECSEELSPAAVRELALSVAERRNNVSGGLPRVTTKVPEDFWDLGLIQILFPRTKIIHCRRDPIDTCLSCYMQNFEDVPFATSLTQLVDVYRLYERVMAHWRSVLPISSFWEISYEELLERPAQMVRDLCDFCGLEFEEGCLQFHRNPRRVQTASLWQVRKPLYKTSVRRWERYREFLGPLLKLAEAPPDRVSTLPTQRSADVAFKYLTDRTADSTRSEPNFLNAH